MPVDPLSEPTPVAQFTLYDVLSPAPKEAALAEFDSLTGGDQTISMVTYNVIDENGNVTTRSMPGQTAFSPVVLLRAMDKSSEGMYLRLKAAIDGKLKSLRRDYSVSMNDSNGEPVVWWDLKNALPIKLDGFMFNMKTENSYTDFEVSLQAESIEIKFMA